MFHIGTVALLLLLLASARCQSPDGPTSVQFIDLISSATFAPKTFDNCKFFALPGETSPAGTPLLVKLLWSSNGTFYDIRYEGPFVAGWLAVGTSASTNSPAMNGADIFISWFDQLGSNVVVTRMTGTGHVPPTFALGSNVAHAACGSTVNDVQFVFSFQVAVSQWGGTRQLMLSGRNSSFDATQTPLMGAQINSNKHTAHLLTPNFSFDTSSPSCFASDVVTTTTTPAATAPPPTPGTSATTAPVGTTAPASNDPCVAMGITTAPSGQYAITKQGSLMNAGTLSWVHDCVNQQTTFTYTMTSAGWIGVGFRAPGGDPNSHMAGADIYQFSSSGKFANRGGAMYDEEPLDNHGTTIVGTPTITSANGVITAVFVRQWAPSSDMTSVRLNSGAGVFDVIAAVNPTSTDITAQHIYRGYMGDDNALTLFPGGSANVPTSPPPTTTTVLTSPTTTFAPGAGPGPCATAASFTNNVALPDMRYPVSYNVTYTIVCGKSITFNVTGPSLGGWLAIGFNSKAGAMAGADTYMMYVGSNGAVIQNSHAAGHDSVPDTTPNQGAGIFIGTPSGSVVGNVFNFQFTRQLTGLDPVQDVTFDGSTNFYMIASHASVSDLTQQHVDHVNSAAAINFYTSSTVVSVGGFTRQLVLVHGALMAAGWVALTPLAVFFARFLKSIGHQWFITHRVMLWLCILLTLVSFGIIIAYKVQNALPQFSTAHEIIGLIVVILMLAEPVLGILADKWWSPERTKTPIWPDMIHWWLGRLLFTLSVINVMLGLAQFANPAQVSFPSSAIIIAIWMLVIIAFFVVGQVVLGTGHGGDNNSLAQKKAMLFRNVAYIMLVPGLFVAVIAIVIAYVTYIG